MSLIKTLLLAELQSHQVSEPNKAAANNNLAAPSFTLSHKTRKILALSLPAWYLSWSLAPFLPEALKPDIDVVSLMEWDHSMFGLLPHQALHEWFQFDPFGFPLVDFLMALPYSLHVFWPILFVLGCARAKRWNTALAFVNCFGIASFGAVFTELYYPTAPPWYYEENGTAPADYSMQGNPGTLDRVDEYFDGKFYHNTFSKSPLVFGAFPSLHVGWPTLLMLFLVHSDICCSSRIKTLIYSYFAWVCFAVVYLQHHYVIDVLGGAAYALITFHLFGPHRDAVEPPRAATKRT